ncbi:hypothetical protein AAG570_003041 [Ranatra chinensis]|uniref:Uncharacterized protein n=1 Tax=Ranatra chinensis TaxID=642074 RepID=A0ABD0YU38_9HEMI
MIPPICKLGNEGLGTRGEMIFGCPPIFPVKRKCGRSKCRLSSWWNRREIEGFARTQDTRLLKQHFQSLLDTPCSSLVDVQRPSRMRAGFRRCGCYERGAEKPRHLHEGGRRCRSRHHREVMDHRDPSGKSEGWTKDRRGRSGAKDVGTGRSPRDLGNLAFRLAEMIVEYCDERMRLSSRDQGSDPDRRPHFWKSEFANLQEK